ncbi:ycf20-like protein [Syzygium oleosum]|uniref:ycf20-like protein n=1 Tax=Syzygium oleosum TaxID=219896 RepID=UPI0011D29792|nr:ycf20-like protein [Syzygium oleosum]
MACQSGAMVMQLSLPLPENEASGSSCMVLAPRMVSNSRMESCIEGRVFFRLRSASFGWNSSQMRRHGWNIAFALNTGGIPGNGEQEGLNGDDADLSRTRLGRIVSAGGRQLLQKLNSARRNFPMKIFLLLLGFYTANALATILGQTGDWDVLVAGVVVAAIEGIGMLVYRKPPSLSSRRLQSFVTMMNYWKSGVCLGLFVDAFKLGS